MSNVINFMTYKFKGDTPIEKIINYLDIDIKNVDINTIRKIDNTILKITNGIISLDMIINVNYLHLFGPEFTINLKSDNIISIDLNSVSISKKKIILDECVLTYLNKNEYYSGKTILLFIINFMIKLGMKKMVISDVSSIDCNDKNIDLFLFKLLKDGKTWYEEFGFKPEIDNIRFISNNGVDDTLKKYYDAVNNIRNIKVIDFKNELIEIFEFLLDLLSNYYNIEIKIITSNLPKNSSKMKYSLVFYLLKILYLNIQIIIKMEKNIDLTNMTFSEYIHKIYEMDCKNYVYLLKLFENKYFNWKKYYGSEIILFKSGQKKYGLSIHKDIGYISNIGHLYSLDLTDESNKNFLD